MKFSDRLAYRGITFDDVLLEPAYSEVMPSDVDVSTWLTQNIPLHLPVISSPMDTVTESEMAIALAQEGGIGIVHKNLPIDRQALEVDLVKRSEHGVIVDPVTLPPSATVGEACEIMDSRNIGGVPITENGTLRGILTRRDLRFLESEATRISEVMTKDNLVTAGENTDLEEAQRILRENKVEKLLLVDENYQLRGLITIKDIDKNLRFPLASKDLRGRLRVGAAVGVRDFERVEALINKGVDVLVVDSAHGHSKNVLETVREIKRRWEIDVIAGNIATKEGARDLIDAGVDAVKVGIGPGSICTTRMISGVGVPQITAVASATEAAEDAGIPVIADGGIRYSGDIAKAIAAGAHTVMLGGLLAGLAESPGEQVLFQGRSFKRYRGMGSLGAMVKGSSERYRQSLSNDGAKTDKKLVPEGVEGRVPYKGPLHDFLYQLIGGLRAGMGYCGTRSISELRRDARFIQISAATVRENHPHDISITQEAPNYTVEHAPVDAG
ncbi:IMP dehydrogenase [Symmachiella dynata]|uniref:Inosine-5'-monophosphate dehydrogenase n=1 Tax=Symmachiella dynata TaxID=2527995 RepID=A0A517ZKV2_9PLAN|nr:IMP dehydrogenase [Symmachiella dynata]QDT47541.1 Inosine-5'-monophosphate dehydrogenase [Symmachiella dynata]QDU43122.1 Inosine-5'-monophosphate dehydrogenase [Symmachiella dynata]